MATYQPIHLKIWSDSWFAELRPQFKLVFLYLLTSPNIHPCGIFECRPREIAFHTGLTDRQAREALDALAGHVEYDSEKNLVWIVNCASYWPWKQTPNVRKAMQLRILSLGDHPFVEGFKNRYPGVMDGLPNPSARNERREEKQEKSSDPSDRHTPAAPSPRQRFFDTSSLGKQNGALIDEARAHGYELDANHTGGMLKRYPKGAVWDALLKAQGDKAANYESRMESVLSDGGANRRTVGRAPSGHHGGDDGGGADEHPASPFTGMGRQAGSSGGET